MPFQRPDFGVSQCLALVQEWEPTCARDSLRLDLSWNPGLAGTGISVSEPWQL